MPIYEYECNCCGQVTEAMQKFSDPPLTQCDHCKGELSRLISKSAFHLKGSGWYVTDYAGKSQGNAGSCKKNDESPKSEKKCEKSDTSSTE